MPRLHYSNHLESLILPLAYELEKRDPFERTDVVVPNYSLEKWISLKIAQINGITANLRFITLENAIFEGVQKRLTRKNYSLLKKDTIQCLLIEILREKLENSDPIWTPLKNYISPKLILNSQAKEHRLFQISKRIAYLFQEYEFSRNEKLIDSWILGKNAFNSSFENSEIWQKELWNGLFGKNGKVTQYNLQIRESEKSNLKPELYTLSQLFRICKLKDNREETKILNKKLDPSQEPLHVFGVSYLSQFHQKALTEELSNFREIYVYSLNPCMEFWEDVQSLGESKTEILKTIESKIDRFSQKKTFSEKEFQVGEELKFEEDNPFLQAWGRPGRENIRLLNQWSNWDFTPWFVQKKSVNNNSNDSIEKATNILSQIQQDILFREPRHLKSLDMEQDDSLMVLACSNPRREVEAVASLIWEWIRNEPDLMLNECAVIANNMEIYQHEIEQVFEETYNLPYHLIDSISGSASRLEDAANALLTLCFTEYTRKDFFNLIKNPFFIRTYDDNSIIGNLNHGDTLNIDKWIQWAEDLNVFYGIDNESNKKWGYNHLENDKYSWEQAFCRLTIGDMVCSETDSDIFSIAKKQIIPADISQDWSLEAARFALIIRSLISDTRELQNWEMKASDWALYIKILIKTYLSPPDKTNEDTFQNLLKNVQAISELDLAQEEGHLFKFTTIIEFFKQKQSSSKMLRGHFLAEGITVSSFKPMRPIPFKAVFLLGMGEGFFPASFKKDTLDLRHIPEELSPPIEGKNFRERLIGDVSDTERDRYMFLETLISTRKHLVLSYISHSDRTNDKLNPSSIIQTLIDELDRGYLKNKFKETIHPLKSYSLRYFPELKNNNGDNSRSEKKLPNYSFSAFSQAKSFYLRELFDQEFPGFERIPSELISPEIKKKFKSNLTLKNIAVDNSERDSTFSISNLRKFLETPLQTSISRLIGFNNQDEESFNKIDEPFILERLNEWSLLRNIWDNALKLQKKERPQWDKLYEKYSQRLELEGIMPSGIFKEAMREKHLKILNNWEKHLTEILDIDWSSLKNNIFKFHFGPVKEDFFKSEKSNNHILRPAISINDTKNSSLEVDSFIIKIQGSTEWWYSDKKDNWYGIYLGEKESKDKIWLRHFLDVLILKLSGIFKEKVKIKGLCISSAGAPKLKEINIPSENQTQGYIVNLIQDILDSNISELMPVESVLELSKEKLDEANYNIRYHDWINEKMKLAKKNLDISSKYGPANFLEDFKSPENPYQVMHRRFDLFFKTIKF